MTILQVNLCVAQLTNLTSLLPVTMLPPYFASISLHFKTLHIFLPMLLQFLLIFVISFFALNSIISIVYVSVSHL